MSASTSVGPPPERARSSAAAITARIAITSLPSTCSPVIPAAIAFWARVSAADCVRRGTEMAHWLLLATKTTGSRRTPAKFIDSYTSPREVAPSPKVHSAARGSPRNANARATPTACAAWVPIGTQIGKSWRCRA